MSKTFSVENFKGVREITLSPEGSLVVIAGGNGAGKSSFIDAFVELFDPKGTRLTPKPIREGEDEARAEYVDTDLDIRIVRTWKKNDAGKLEVLALDGAKYSKPAEIVASLTGGLIFDPVQFLNLDEKRQRDALLAKVDLPFDIDALARTKASAEQRRLDAGREVNRLQGALESLSNPGGDVPEEEVSAADVLADIEAAQRIAHERDAAGAEYDALAARYDELGAQIEELRRQQSEVGDRQERAKARFEGFSDVPDIAPLQDRLRQLDEINQAVRARKARNQTAEELALAEAAYRDAQAEIKRIEVKKTDGLRGATFPVDGLSVDESGVTFEGVPFVQTNSATRLRVAFAIATAGDPKLKLVIARMGDMLDDNSLNAVREMAEARGYTVLMERDRDSSREIGFTIREGVLDAPAK
jgi:phage shock protein A